jgi:hypothetical protein
MIILGLFLFWSAVVFVGGAFAFHEGLHRAVFALFNVAKQDIRQILDASIPQDTPHLELLLKQSAYQQILDRRNNAIKGPILIAESDDEVKGYARLNGDAIPISLRLKGDWTSHLRDSLKWSFRIEIKDNAAILGMERFSLHHPRERNYVGEWIFFEALKKEGIIAPRYDFIRVSLNDQDLGLYAIEEHFTKQLLESNGRREGPIVRFDESLLWLDWATFWETRMRGGGTGVTSYQASAVDAFDTSDILVSQPLHDQFMTAFSLLEAYRLGRLHTGEVFNLDRLATFFALSDLFGGTHGLAWHNLRWYYNPITGLLEPIGFDANAGRVIAGLRGDGRELRLDGLPLANSGSVEAQFFADPAFRGRYVQELERLSEAEWIDEFFLQFAPEMKEKLSVLRSEFPSVADPEEAIRANAAYIRSVLFFPGKGIHAFAAQGQPEAEQQIATIQVGNLQLLPMEILGIEYDGKVYPPIGNVGVILQARTSFVDYKEIDFKIPLGLSQVPSKLTLAVRYRVFGGSGSTIRTAQVFPWPYLDDSFSDYISKARTSTIDQFEFLDVRASDGVIVVRPGKWEISRTLVIPAGFIVYCSPGTVLWLTNQASIISYSSLCFAGTEDSPIEVRGDFEGGGLLIIGPSQASEFSYVAFLHLSAPTGLPQAPSGGVTIYESDATFTNCLLLGGESEDGMNLIRTRFSLDSCVFRDMPSDALDVDFGDGSIVRCQFFSVGNDAMDFSGSMVDISNCTIMKTGDKGLSAGENSVISIESCSISGAYVAIASKDLSDVTVNSLSIADCQYGLAVYQKKPEFGPSSLAVTGFVTERIDTNSLVEMDSTLILDGQTQYGGASDVLKTLYPN